MNSALSAVFRTEMRRLLRDRKALFMAVVLPMALYPLLFLGTEKLESSVEESLQEKQITLSYQLEDLPLEAQDRIEAALREGSFAAELTRLDSGQVTALRERLSRTEAESWVGTDQDLYLWTEKDPLRAVLVFDRGDTLSNEAQRRTAEVLERIRAEMRDEAMLAVTGSDPAAELEIEPEDVASEEDTAGRALGKLLPLLAILMLVSGASFAALDAFAGERESGTLETLFVQPVPANSIALGKFLSVLLTALFALVGNTVSFLVCVSLGLGELPNLGDAQASPQLGRAALGLVLFLPTSILIAAVFCLVSARARSFREGQNYVLPIVLVSVALSSFSMVDQAQLDGVLAAVPITGPALALRAALQGRLSPLPAVVMLAASSFWALVALSQLSKTLDAERHLATREVGPEAGARRQASRRAIAWGAISILAVYVLGGRLQAAAPIPGLLLTLYGVVPLCALWTARSVARGEPLARSLALGVPRWTHVLGGISLAPALAFTNRHLFALQERFLPMPELALPEALTELGPVPAFLLLAVSPGLMEELLFRGAIQGGLRKDLSWARTVGWQALLFGAVHASIYRFLPTAWIGAVLSAVAWRARSIWPAVALHTSYNGLLALNPDGEGPGALLALGGAVLGGLLFASTSGRPEARTDL